jgi:hypothetical protein
MNKGATSLPRYSRDFFARRSEDTGFVRDTLEKVYRLVDILEYFNRNPLLRESVALKGGTAINLTIFNLPRPEMVLGHSEQKARSVATRFLARETRRPHDYRLAL